MKKFLSFCLFFSMVCTSNVFAENSNSPIQLNSQSAILLDVKGNVIFENNADTPLEPASVTKVMTTLLAMEALELGLISKDDIVTVSKLAEGQGGTQVFLKEGEQITVDELLKSIMVSSANDASVALGEFIAGSNDAFIDMMNEKAKLLGMENTTFLNANGLPETGHVMSARDIALMSVEILAYADVYEYTTIWMDSIRDGEFELANTNKMLRTYEGMVGLKTGYTTNAKYCISATAIRGEEQFIAVVMGAETVDDRTDDIKAMLDYAFANYKTQDLTVFDEFGSQYVQNGQQDFFEVKMSNSVDSVLLNKNANVTYEIEYDENLTAPIYEGDVVGRVNFYVDGEFLSYTDIVSKEEVLQRNFFFILSEFLSYFFMKN